jgi:hypothetical protein
MRYALAFVVSLVLGCGSTPEPPDGADCYLHPELAECSCDDGNPCTEDVREFDGCKNDHVVYGAACIGEPGFCDVGGVCRQFCDEIPCLDSEVQEPYGCVYARRSNGWTCMSDDEQTGVCYEGQCLITGLDSGPTLR